MLSVVERQHLKWVGRPGVSDDVGCGVGACLDRDICGGKGRRHGIHVGDCCDQNDGKFTDYAVEIGRGQVKGVISCQCPLIRRNIGKLQIPEYGIAVVKAYVETGTAVAGIDYSIEP